MCCCTVKSPSFDLHVSDNEKQHTGTPGFFQAINHMVRFKSDVSTYSLMEIATYFLHLLGLCTLGTHSST